MEAVFGNDVRPLLRSINAPTLVLVRSEVDERIRRDARCLADGIPGSELTELAGADDLPWIGDASSVTDRISEFLTGVSRRVGVERIVATVLFTDIVGSTERAAALGDRRWSEMLSTHHAIVREQLRRFDGEEIDVAGDGFFARFTGPARAIECACAIRDAVQRVGLAIRAGVHTGEVELLGDDLRGIAVHIGARVGAHASANEVLVSRTVADLIAGSEIALEDRGEWDLRGVPGRWRLYAVAAVRDAGL